MFHTIRLGLIKRNLVASYTNEHISVNESLVTHACPAPTRVVK